MTLHDFLGYVASIAGPPPADWRLGQWAFNLLHAAYPQIADQIRGTNVDPFYVDVKMVPFLKHLLEQFVRG